MTLNSEMSWRFSSSKTTCFTLIEGTLSVVKDLPDDSKTTCFTLINYISSKL